MLLLLTLKKEILAGELPNKFLAVDGLHVPI